MEKLEVKKSKLPLVKQKIEAARGKPNRDYH